MTIDWLYDLEQEIENGKEILACPTVGRNQWAIGLAIDDLRRMAKRVADGRKISTKIVQLISKHDAVTGDDFLVPTRIGDPGSRGEPQIEWTVVETREAAEMMRDVRRGAPPYFGMQEYEVIEPTIVDE